MIILSYLKQTVFIITIVGHQKVENPCLKSLKFSGFETLVTRDCLHLTLFVSLTFATMFNRTNIPTRLTTIVKRSPRRQTRRRQRWLQFRTKSDQNLHRPEGARKWRHVPLQWTWSRLLRHPEEEGPCGLNCLKS